MSYTKFHQNSFCGVNAFHVDGRTDMTNSVTARFNRFPKAPKRGLTLIVAFLSKYLVCCWNWTAEKRRPVLDDWTENRIKVLRFALRKLKRWECDDWVEWTVRGDYYLKLLWFYLFSTGVVSWKKVLKNSYCPYHKFSASKSDTVITRIRQSHIYSWLECMFSTHCYSRKRNISWFCLMRCLLWVSGYHITY